MSNIIVLAGGMQNNIDLARNGDEGAVLLILDPETGNLIKGFTPGDVINGDAVGTAAPGRYPAMGMMVSEPTLMRTARRDSEYWPYLAGSIYAADNRGTIFRVDLERVDGDDSVISLSPNQWKISAVATLQRTAEASKSSASGYALPFGVQLMIQDDYTWIAGGTSDLRGKKSGAYPTGVLQNAGQMIFAFRTGKGEGVYGTDSLKNVSGSALLASDYEDYHGWKIPLTSSQGYGAQYVSAKPLAVNGVLYVATFMEKKISTDNASQLCDSRASRIDGTARLYVLDLMSGGAKWRAGQYATMNGAKITGITLSTQGKRQRIVITYDKLREKVNLDGAEGAARLDDLNAFVLPLLSPGGGTNLSDGQNVIQYWLKR
jgi:hypothetical protein